MKAMSPANYDHDVLFSDIIYEVPIEENISLSMIFIALKDCFNCIW